MALQKGRRDHYLPQSYLRGFIDPARENLPQPLWQLDIRHNVWSMKSTKQIAHGEGFYDYAGDSPELENLESADDSFLDLENEFPRVREKLIVDCFRNWKRHRRFLFKFMQMLRARSPLFFEQKQAEGKALKTWTVKEAHPDGKTITLDSMEPKPPSDAFIKNRTILHMREEIKKGADWLWGFHWSLRLCDSVDTPFVMSEAPFLAVGDRPGEIGQMLRDPETLLFSQYAGGPACLAADDALIKKPTILDRRT